MLSRHKFRKRRKQFFYLNFDSMHQFVNLNFSTWSRKTNFLKSKKCLIYIFSIRSLYLLQYFTLLFRINLQKIYDFTWSGCMVLPIAWTSFLREISFCLSFVFTLLGYNTPTHSNATSRRWRFESVWAHFYSFNVNILQGLNARLSREIFYLSLFR